MLKCPITPGQWRYVNHSIKSTTARNEWADGDDKWPDANVNVLEDLQGQMHNGTCDIPLIEAAPDLLFLIEEYQQWRREGVDRDSIIAGLDTMIDNINKTLKGATTRIPKRPPPHGF